MEWMGGGRGGGKGEGEDVRMGGERHGCWGIDAPANWRLEWRQRWHTGTCPKNSGKYFSATIM